AAKFGPCKKVVRRNPCGGFIASNRCIKARLVESGLEHRSREPVSPGDLRSEPDRVLSDRRGVRIVSRAYLGEHCPDLPAHRKPEQNEAERGRGDRRQSQL